MLQRLYGPDTVVAEIKYQNRPPHQIRFSDITVAEKLEKFVEDVKLVYKILQVIFILHLQTSFQVFINLKF